jgi:DNA-binding GntR family transcriptional regulator
LLPPGTRLVDAQIVDSLNANRNHVQAALKHLALQKIVTIEPNRGAHSCQPTAREARKIFVARRAIEGAVVASITPQRVRQFEAQVNAHMAAAEKATRKSDRRAIVQELNSIHLLLGRISGNSMLSDILDNLMVRSSLIVALYQRNDEPTCQHREHRDILQALSAGEGEKAVKLMKHHLDHLAAELALEKDQDRRIDLKAVLASV